MAKRYRVLKAKEGELRMAWAIDEPGNNPGIVYAWGEGCRKADGSLLHYAMDCEHVHFSITDRWGRVEPAFLKELERRGYDLTTAKFSIRKAPTQDTQSEQGSKEKR
jgi:hypothetical protein